MGKYAPDLTPYWDERVESTLDVIYGLKPYWLINLLSVGEILTSFHS